MRRSSPLILTVLLALGACGESPAAQAPGTVQELPPYASDYVIPARALTVKVDRTTDDQRARRLAYEHYRALRGGASWAEMTRLHGSPGIAAMQGFIGFLRVRKQTRLLGAVQALEEGQISRPVRTESGWAVVQRLSFEEGARLEREITRPAYIVSLVHRAPRGGSASFTPETAKAAVERIASAVNDNGADFFAAAAMITRPKPGERAAHLIRVTAAPEMARVKQALDGVPNGGISKPFDHNGAWHVLHPVAPLRAEVQEILIQHRESVDRDIRITRSREDAQLLAATILERLAKEPSAWPLMVKNHSDKAKDTGASGDIGIIGNSDVPPALERALNQTAPGSVHPTAVETEFGIHILRRTR